MAKRINWTLYEERIRELRQSYPAHQIAAMLGVNRSSLAYYINTGMWSARPGNDNTGRKPYDMALITEDIYAWRFGFELLQENWDCIVHDEGQGVSMRQLSMIGDQ